MRRWAAGALALAAAACGCGEKEERVTGPTRAEVQALVSEGLGAVGARGNARLRSVTAGIRVRVDGPVLRLRLPATPLAGSPLAALAGSVNSLQAELRPFCPKPALLRCRPALRAWATPGSDRAFSWAVVALRRLAARTYAATPLVRRGGGATRVVTSNGELLGAVRRTKGAVALSFGGVPLVPRRPHAAPTGRLQLEAGAAALAAARSDLSPAARRALAGVRRVIVSAPL